MIICVIIVMFSNLFSGDGFALDSYIDGILAGFSTEEKLKQVCVEFVFCMTQIENFQHELTDLIEIPANLTPC